MTGQFLKNNTESHCRNNQHKTNADKVRAELTDCQS